ncbi:MAG: hypothetical protein RLZZ200_2099 [Pseudomonadota bacterium]|jgi:drug/metabolite transporter (DMT)-like permease
MSTPNPARRATVGLLLAAGGAILFASKGLFAKALYAEGVDFRSLTLLRSLIALPMFLVLALHHGIRLGNLPKRAAWGAAFAGVWCYAIGALIDFHALELIDVSIERSLLFSYPALVVLYTTITTKRLPSRSVVAAVIATYAGILLVVGGFDAIAWKRNLGGSAMVLFCATTTATYFLIGERTMAQLGSMGFTIIAMTAATVATLLLCLPYHPLDAALRVSPHGWLLLLALAVLCMLLPTLMQAAGIQRIGAVRGALVSTVGPPAALLLGAALLGERPGPAQLAGTVLIVIGVVVIGRAGKQAPSAD